jgi:hypothetical protein
MGYSLVVEVCIYYKHTFDQLTDLNALERQIYRKYGKEIMICSNNYYLLDMREDYPSIEEQCQEGFEEMDPCDLTNKPSRVAYFIIQQIHSSNYKGREDSHDEEIKMQNIDIIKEVLNLDEVPLRICISSELK